MINLKIDTIEAIEWDYMQGIMMKRAPGHMAPIRFALCLVQQ